MSFFDNEQKEESNTFISLLFLGVCGILFFFIILLVLSSCSLNQVHFLEKEVEEIEKMIENMEVLYAP